MTEPEVDGPFVAPKGGGPLARSIQIARLLPVLGALALVLGVFWAGDLARAGIVLFGLWTLLVVVAGALAPRLARRLERGEESGTGEP